jgi:hypothetical protein
MDLQTFSTFFSSLTLPPPITMTVITTCVVLHTPSD